MQGNGSMSALKTVGDAVRLLESFAECPPQEAAKCAHCDRWHAQVSEQLSRVKELEAEIADAERALDFQFEREDDADDSPTIEDFFSAMPPGSRLIVEFPNDGDD